MLLIHPHSVSRKMSKEDKKVYLLQKKLKKFQHLYSSDKQIMIQLTFFSMKHFFMNLQNNFLVSDSNEKRVSF